MKIEEFKGSDSSYLNSPKFVAKSVFVEAGSSFADADGLIYDGRIYPSNDASAEGIVFGTYDVSIADAQIAVIHTGVINTNKMPEAISANAKTALVNIVFEDNKY